MTNNTKNWRKATAKNVLNKTKDSTTRTLLKSSMSSNATHG